KYKTVLLDKISQLSSQVKELQDKNTHLHQKIEDASKNFEQEKKSAQNDAHRSFIEAMDELKDSKAKIIAMEKEIQLLLQEREHLIANCEFLNNSCMKLEDENLSMKSSIQKLSQELDFVKKKFQVEKHDFQ